MKKALSTEQTPENIQQILTLLTDKQWTRTIQEDGKKRKESVYWRARG